MNLQQQEVIAVPKISVVIVNYRSWKHLTNCLNSLNVIVSEKFNLEVVVVDNCSNDGFLEKFKQKYKAVKFIENSGNNGFANGCNVGAKNANGDYLLFLNPDTIAAKDALLEMLYLSKTNEDYGIISCSQVNPKGKRENEIRLFPKLQTLFGLSRAIFKRTHKKEIHKIYDVNKKVIFPDWVSGSVIFMSKFWFNQVNGWDENFWMYFEDVDLCKRVQEKKGKVVLSRNAKIIHNHGGASRLNVKTTSITKTEVIISKHVYINTHFNGLNKFIALILLVLNTFLTKFVLGIFGLVFYPIPKMRLQLFLFLKILSYYANAIFHSTWISKKSLNYSK
ncbi:MAG: glycosyltransferase family 2 protein [Lutibacter sp.]|uniref:glycosyltransferase family 2 protein n=1 Tax=Lutibacter sp. TaxID=1925666 RepID=UPI00299D2893|nr:glycosyltransferase family 2 protein [Lutibacter sp.]MDX1828419.1 glycosyltransferase family 2 protein [Lutibacter sp.]